MNRDFVHESAPGRVRFAVGALDRLPAEIDRLGLRRVIVVCSPDRPAAADAVTESLGTRSAGLHPHAEMHVPAGIADRAVARCRELDADGCVAVGGGSAIGLAKVIALRTGLPVVAVPTTYSGSEMTPVWGLTTDGRKITGRDPRVRPVSVVYDPALTVGLPPAVSSTSAVNAVAHAAEALYAPDATPVTSLLAAESVRVLARVLPSLASGRADIDDRADALYGSWLAGTVLGATTMSLHHKLCHVLGGAFDLPHAPTHTAVLPHVLALNLRAHAEARTALVSALGTPDPAGTLHRLALDTGAEMSLAALGLPADGIGSVVDAVLDAPYANPVPVTREAVRRVLDAAFAGVPPT
ncbi:MULTISPECIES: maleylacetate reductase [Pseudonocardia]|uniref:Maleylacetate reductase n=2 Tax=Pseudonocardia TaxID=1847 RepID=A0A1Y2N4K2_PSEAH|nr:MULTISPECIES: maleylacetate reductase [Pseudonocardia]OSY42007.1 Maleylacetate reductase [Pseudonocardia autotrophica]TDN75224.1 maleylacetate reductase [Pseudonocardia autotrophica]BBF99169.1 maleylacetate reductase [Pseudonocardia autotrophica]GEC28578.1 maleylacetate reductase [Pseudonocardia saturnea]